MNKVYSRINWKNYPSEETALNEKNLNKMDLALDNLDNRVIEMDATKINTVVKVKDIDDVIIVHSDQSQESLGLGGYLDIGIIDTMKDLFVNFIGAVVFSILGFIYVKTRGKGKIASSFIPQVNMNEESPENKEKGNYSVIMLRH